MEPSLSFDKLHDATLTKIVLDWPLRVAELHLRTPTSPSRLAVIIASGMEQFTVPRFAPWGDSSSINSTRVDVAAGRQPRKLEIEMQSGDVILILADDFRLQFEKV